MEDRAMEKLTAYLTRFQRRIASMGAGALVAAVVLAMLSVGGAAWLTWSMVRPAAVPVTVEPVSARDLAGLRAELDRRGISCRMEDGRPCVRAEDLDTARAILSKLKPRRSRAMDNLTKVAESDDIWSSQAQRDRRWQVARMALLGEQISSLNGVDSAVVSLSPSTPGRFGRPGRTGGALVTLAMQAGKRADDALCETMADMVAHSAAVRREDVCIVDSHGRRYRPAPAPRADGIIARTGQGEAYHAARVRKALSYIGGLIVTVRAAAGPPQTDQVARCIGVSVSIPRSYLEAAHRDHGAGRPLADFAADRRAGIVRTVMYETQLTDPAAVAVTWYQDAGRDVQARAAPAAGGDKRILGGSWAALAGLALGGAAVLAGGWLLLRRGAAVRQEAGRAAADGAVSSPAGAEDRAGGPFAFLLKTPAEELLTLLEGEHPQTIALVLAHLGPGRAAAVLAGLEPERQVDVIRRIAGLGAPAGEVADEIARGLAARMGITGDDGDEGGISTAAEILHHAGYDAEQVVLDGLKGNEPALADSIRRRMFEFEDITTLSPETVGRALTELGTDDIAVALRTADDQIRAKVLASLAGDAAGKVRQAMDRIGPVRLSDVEAAQQRVASAMRRAGGGGYVSDEVESRVGETVETGAQP